MVVLAARTLRGGPDQGLEPTVVGQAMAVPLTAFGVLFGLGGLVAGHILDVHGAQAVVVATGAGVVGMGLAMLVLETRHRAKD